MKKGTHHSEKTRKKISEAQKGKTISEVAKRKMSKSKKGKTRKPFTEETKRKMSEAQKGKNLGKTHTEATKKKMSEAQKGRPPTNKGRPHTKETKRKISEAQKGKTISEVAKRKQSATRQSIPYDEWESYACEKKYCPKFNEACKESNREKHGRRCFMCNKTEKANGQKLSVHHVDMDKAQGCKSNWKLIPLCKHCHATAHNDEIVARLGYILKR
jgi:hypothetical protein